ncbi:MAG: cupredoxin domain-containing protein, partial [Vicinamibacterales bacterium]
FCAPHPWMRAMIIVEGQPIGGTAETTAFGDEPDPPSISLARAGLFVGGIIALVFGAAYLMRRPDEEPVPAEDAASSDGDDD